MIQGTLFTSAEALTAVQFDFRTPQPKAVPVSESAASPQPLATGTGAFQLHDTTSGGPIHRKTPRV
jgi:hypothetical protein